MKNNQTYTPLTEAEEHLDELVWAALTGEPAPRLLTAEEQTQRAHWKIKKELREAGQEAFDNRVMRALGVNVREAELGEDDLDSKVFHACA